MKLINKLNTQFNRNIFYNSFGSISYCVFQYLITIVILRVKGAGDAGVYSLAYSFTNIFAIIAAFGMGAYQLSDVRRRHTDGTYLAARILTSFAAFLSFAAALLFTGFSREIAVCGAFLMLYRIIENISGVYICILQKTDEYKTIGISYTLKGLIPFLLFCAAIYFFNLYAAVLAMCAAYTLIFIIIDFKRVTSRPEYDARVIKRDILKILPPSFILVAQGLIGNFIIFFPRYVIEKIYTIEELGYFSSVTLIMFVLPFLTGPALNVFIPGLSRLYDDKEYYIIKRMTFRMGLCVIAATVAMCASSLFWGRFALRVVFGEKILPYSFVLMPTLLVSGFMLGCGVLGGILTAMQKRKEVLIAAAAAALTVILICPVFVRKFYMSGSLYCLMAAFTVHGFIQLGFLLYHLKKPAFPADNKSGKFVL